MHRVIKAKSGHTLYVASIKFKDLPDNVKEYEYIKDYPNLYVVKNWDKDGHVFMYLGSGYVQAPNEIVVWYAQKGSFWSSYGTTLENAINEAQADGWEYA